MTDNGRKFESWEDVIKDFLQQKTHAEEEKYLKARIDEINKIYKERNYFEKSVIESFFDPKKNKKKDTETALDFQRSKFQKIFKIEKQIEGLDRDVFMKEYREKCEEIKDKYEPHRWISQAAHDAKSVSFATHVFKLTHSKIDSPSLFDQVDSKWPGVLSTSDLREKTVDGAVKGNQFAPVYQFLELELNGKKMATEVVNTTGSVLESFATSDEDLLKWSTGFKKALINGNPSTHSLAKQVYFPIKNVKPLNSDSYHLIANVQSSSFAQAIFEKQYIGDQKKTRKLRDKNKFTNNSVTSYAKKAVIKVTQSNHGNASQLNGKRGGKFILFSSQPPIWEHQLKQPITKSSFFYNIPLRQSISANLDYLRDFLLRFERTELSIQAPDRKKWILNWVLSIIEEVFAYAASIHRLPPGWSNTETIKLKKAHQYFLDPFRDDEEFQAARASSDWQTVICKDFAAWLNGRLSGKEKKFTPQPQYTRIWKNIMKNELREFSETLNMHLQNNTEAVR